MSRLLLLFVAGMIFAAHSSLISKVCQFLKLDYLTKRLKLYAWLHELKELCHHFMLLSDFSLLKSSLRTTSKHKNRLVFCYWNFFLQCFLSGANLYGILLIGRGIFRTKNCDHVQPHLVLIQKLCKTSKCLTQHNKSIQSSSKTHISAKKRYLWINFSNVCSLQDSLSELGEIDGASRYAREWNACRRLVNFTNGEITKNHFSDYQYSGY